MTTFVLIPGAGGSAFYWSRIVPKLGRASHQALAVNLPGADPHAGIVEYAELVVHAVGERDDVVVVAQSLGGFTAPLVCERIPVRALVLVNAMIPRPGEKAGDFWGHTGAEEARVSAARRGGYRTDFDIETYFLHDVPRALAEEGAPHQHQEAKVTFTQPCDFSAWPDVPIHVIAGRDDRFFPVEFQQRVAHERLGRDVITLPGGHLVALSNPAGLTEKLLAVLG
jgi:pimeloyl-ACP methyl ester carboxylesterase